LEGIGTLTCELAHRRTPPIGAKITPTTKNSGNTLFGFKIGLFNEYQKFDFEEFFGKNCMLTARP
jgi:hypothetical protein